MFEHICHSEIETKCEEILDEDILMPVRSPSRSSRDRSASSRRRRSSSASVTPAKRSSSRISTGSAAAQQGENRRATTPEKDSKRSGSATSVVAEESEFRPTPNELRLIQSYTSGKPLAARKGRPTC